MERVRTSLKGRSWRKVITYFLTCCMFLNTSLPVVLATPTPIGGGFTVGAGTITQAENATNVVVDQLQSVIEWSSLDTVGGVPADRESLNFSQGTLTNSAVLNRISGDITHFGGDLNALGMRIFMVNPAGIMFESGSTVNVTQLVASGLGMTNDAFQAVLDDPDNNKMEFLEGNGEVISRAKITANSVYLIGKKVWNISSISAKDGLVVMAAGDEVRLFQDGSDVSVVVNTEGDGFDYPDIRNSGNVDVLNGKIVLAAGDTFSRAIYIASYLTAQGGTVEVQAALVKSRGRIDVSAYPAGADGDGGSISLTGVDEVIISPSIFDDPGLLFANAGLNGKGGDITIQTEGKLTIEENTLITANGGSGLDGGNGGSVTITCDDFEIAGDIDASFGNKMSGEELSEPGKLVINSPSAIIADGPNPADLDPLDLPDEDTIYEEDIEALSKAGTSLIVNAEEGITVKDIDDNEITGQFGSIELHATGENSAVTFADVTDTIRTSLGDIIIEAGFGGITVGNLITGKDLASEKPAPGQIMLTTHNGGDIATGDLIIEDGWGHAEINVNSSHDLTVNGDVIVGSDESSILNVADQRPAEAVIKLKAVNDVTLNGNVEAHAHGSEVDTSITKATIDIIAGNDATITGNLSAEATSSGSGTADAVITVEAVGEIDFPGSATAIANDATAESTDPHSDDEETTTTGHAQIIINDSAIFLVDDIGIFSTNKSVSNVELDVLANDTLVGGETIVDASLDNPAEGTLTIGQAGDVLLYNPPENLSVLTFDENGKAVVTFTYTVDGKIATGDVTLINGLPVAVDDVATTYLGKPVSGNVLANDTDMDLDDVLTVVAGTITTKNGTLVLNVDGTFTYTPNEGFVGDDSFTYSATDSFNTTSEVEVKITVAEEPPAPPVPPVPSYMLPAPGLDRMIIEVQTSGCPALVKWVAEEIGIDQRMVQIWITNSLASTGDIQPCDACAELKNSAQILQDADGSHIAALTQVISEFASSNTPPTEEQMASIADAIARNTDEDSYYAVAGEYLDALATYVGVLNNDMGFSAVESVQFVTDKYVGRLAQGDNVGVATFIAANLAALGG